MALSVIFSGSRTVQYSKVGAKKGIPQLGTVVIPISQGINSIVNGENIVEVVKDFADTFVAGKAGSKLLAPKLKLNSEAISVFLSSFVETINEKIKNTEKNKDV
jgi:phenylacetate-coenzyme A ligase PaaK-like adenylate-forming protein